MTIQKPTPMKGKVASARRIRSSSPTLQTAESPQRRRDDLVVVECELLGQLVGEVPRGLGRIVAPDHRQRLEPDVGKIDRRDGPAARVAARDRPTRRSARAALPR